MNLIELLTVIRDAVKNYVATGENYKTQYEIAELERNKLIAQLNEATELANQIQIELNNKGIM